MTPEQLYEIGQGSRIIARALKEAGMEKHFALAMTPTLITEIRRADQAMMFQQDHKNGDDTFVGVPVEFLKTNGGL